MIATSTRYDDTITATDADVNSTCDKSWHTIILTNLYKDEDKYVMIHIQEELEWMREGWFNPRKVPTKHQVLNRHHNKVIRSQLPQRIRINQPKEIIQ